MSDCMAQFSWVVFGLRVVGTVLQLYGFGVVMWRLLELRLRLGRKPLRTLVAEQLWLLWYRATRRSVGAVRISAVRWEVPGPPPPPTFQQPTHDAAVEERLRRIEQHLPVVDERLAGVRDTIDQERDQGAQERWRAQQQQREEQTAELTGVRRELWAVVLFMLGTVLANLPDALVCLLGVGG
jgi:hypothetical protein